ncbi:DinB family protein [uncultured Cyclobacterium sp.]|uniref:DinB family protein n=1 Tax=uncultured Cyclobacterium sp. TaxID=453820 RepID=UPI0030EF9980|tara:strand:+ start:141424 stop:141951 length:528 start_codon:yes stop_codon:yes gene_type:complete
MKAFIYIQLTIMVLVMGSSSLKAQAYFSDQFPDVWKRSMDNSRKMAEAMPANLYDYKPTPEAMSFRDQILHIAGNISYLTATINGEKKSFFEKEDTQSLDKDAIIAILDAANNYVLELIKETDKSQLDEEIVFANENMTKENIFYLLRGHQTHHRAQCLVYLRLNGIKAPAYVGW